MLASSAMLRKIERKARLHLKGIAPYTFCRRAPVCSSDRSPVLAGQFTRHNPFATSSVNFRSVGAVYAEI